MTNNVKEEVFNFFNQILCKITNCSKTSEQEKKEKMLKEMRIITWEVDRKWIF